MPNKPPSEIVSDQGAVPNGERWRFGDFELDELRRELRLKGELVELEKKPLNLLMVFLRHPGQLLTKNDLLEAVWPGRIVVEAVLGNAVAKLRDALGEAGTLWLKTVFGFGYRFDAPVERITDDSGTTAPPRLSFNAGDTPPGRPNWQLVSRLGLSGDSWLAEHIKTKARRVFKFTSEPLGLSALKREVTVFRLLRESVGEKACYVDVLDWNFDEPPWFIEAEYCPGGSLQEWFNQQGGIRNVPLGVRLDLIAQIAEALAEIHIVGILHKDLKPANVFVVINAEGKPTIRLGDFGSSRLVDATRIAALEITRMGFTQVIDAGSDTSTGTPLYFAPEVLAGQPVTVKADIYALGVMLYQFVVGNLRRQLGAGWEVEVDDEMLREDIALAAESNPERRLADAAELARNLRRIETRRIERAAQREAQARAERAARAMERLKARRVGLMAAFASLVIGCAVSAFLYVEARHAQDLAEQQAASADKARIRAQRVADFLAKDMFRPINTNARPVKDLTVKQLLDAASLAVESSFNAEPDIAASVYEALGRSFESLEYIPEAGANIEKAFNIYQAAGDSAFDHLVRLAPDLIELKYPTGELRKKIKIYQSIYEGALIKLGAADTAVLMLQLSLARGRIQLGQFEASKRELLKIDAELKGSDTDRRNEISRQVTNGLSYVCIELKDYSCAEKFTDKLKKDAISRFGINHREVGLSDVRLARIYFETDRLDAAEKTLKQATKVSSEWDTNKGALALNIKLYLAWLRFYQGRYSEAVDILTDVKRLVADDDASAFSQSFSEDRPLGLSYSKLGMKREALVVLARGYRSAESSLGAEHPWTLQIKQDIDSVMALKVSRNADNH